MITETELTEIEARANAATEGPWLSSCQYGELLFVLTNDNGILASGSVERGNRYEDFKLMAAARTDIHALAAALREAWDFEARANDMLHDTCAENTSLRARIAELEAVVQESTEQAELWLERGIAEWQGAVATLTAENERLQARISELECLLVSWHYGPTMQDTSHAFRLLKEIAKSLAAVKPEAKP